MDRLENSKIEWLTVLDTARFLGCSCDWVRHLERTGKLKAQRTKSGIRLFQRTDIEKFLFQRISNPPKRGKPRRD